MNSARRKKHRRTQLIQGFLSLALLIFLLIGLYFMIKDASERAKQINKYNCAVYGYQEDCETPLSESERLK